jgi:Uma2 family endonuclease
VATVSPIATLQAIQAEAQKKSLYYCEVIDGIAVQKPLPKRLHQIIQQRIYDLLRAVCPDTFVVYQTLNYLCSGQLYIPDIVVASATAKYDNDDLVEPPALIVEVLSPGQTVGQLYDKGLNYLADGVKDVWIVVPRKAGYVCRPNGDLAAENVLRTVVSGIDVEIRLDELFANLPATK